LNEINSKNSENELENKLIDFDLKNQYFYLFDEFYSMPDCCEKFILELMFFIKCKLLI